MTLEDRLERLASRRPPGDPAEVLAAARRRAKTDRIRRRAGSPRLLTAAAAVVMVLALAAAVVTLLDTDDDGAVTTAAPSTVSSLYDEWHLVETVRGGDRRLAVADASISVTRDGVYGADGCGNTFQTVLDGDTIAHPGFHSLAGCVDPTANDDSVFLWTVLEQEPRLDLDGDALTVEAPGGNALVFARAEDHTAQAQTPRLLPGWVPEGYRLAWMDIPAEPPADIAGVPLHERPHHYAFGYQTAGAELEVRVLIGAMLDDPEAVADEWNALAVPSTAAGRQAVGYTDASGCTQLLVEADGGVVMVSTHPLGNSFPDGLNAAMPPRDVVDRFAASMETVEDDEWDAAFGATPTDVATTFGPKEAVPVVEGDGWTLVHGYFRAPLAVRWPSVWVDFAGTPSPAVGAASSEAGGWHAEISVHDDVRVAWGVVPAEVATVEVTVGGEVFDATVERLANGPVVFAVDVSDSAGDGSFRARGATGIHVASGPIDAE